MKYFQKTCKKVSVSADGFGHPQALRWPEEIGTLGANTHLKKMQLHRQHD